METLGFKDVLEYMNIPYTKNKTIKEEVVLGEIKVEQLKWII